MLCGDQVNVKPMVKMYIGCLLTFILAFFVLGINAQNRSVTVDPATVKLGEDALMTCTYTLAPGDELLGLSWYKSNSAGSLLGDSIVSTTGNTTNDRYSLYNNGSLGITDVEVVDGDYYLCRIITTDTNVVEGFSTLTVSGLYVTVDPTTVKVGDDALMTCTYTLAQGDVLLTMTWYKSNSAGSPLGDTIVSTTGKTTNDRYSLYNNGSLGITDVEVVDADYYLCRIFTTEGSFADGFSTLTVNPIGLYVTVDPATVKLDEDVLMTCTYTLGTEDTLLGLSWFKSNSAGSSLGDAIVSTTGETTNDRYSIYNNGSLGITDVEVVDAGYYLCRIITTDINIAAGFSTLTVNYLETPVLKPEEMSVQENETAIFTCSPDGVPTPITMTWIKDGDELDVSDTEKYPQSNTILEISRVNEMDEGDYQCLAENTAYNGNEGKLSNTGTLSLLSSPTSTFIIASRPTSATMSQEGSCSDTGLVVGMIFLGIFIGIILSSSVFVVLWKMRKATPQVTEATSRNDKQPAAYMAYRGAPNTENQTYEDLQKNDNDNPVVYVNVKK